MDAAISNKVDAIDLGHIEAEQCNRAVYEQTTRQKHHLMGSIEGGEVGRQEYQPEESSSSYRDKDVPGFVEISRELAGEEAKDCTDHTQEEVEGEGREEGWER